MKIKVYCYICKDDFYVDLKWFLKNFLHIRKCFRFNRRDYLCFKCLVDGNKEAGVDYP